MSDKPDVPDEAMRRAMGHLIATSDMLRAIGITDPRQVETPPGNESFLMRLAAWFAIPDCQCGGEHLACDHDESTAP